jgi:hypothetical protein
LVPRARLELARLAARDFESRASTDSAIGAFEDGLTPPGGGGRALSPKGGFVGNV